MTGERALRLLMLVTIMAWPGESLAAGRSRDVVFVLDVSGSMIGKAQGRDVFAQVVAPVATWVEKSVKAGDTVWVLTFADGLHDLDGNLPSFEASRRFAVESDADKAAVIGYVHSLNEGIRAPDAWGARTAVWDAVLHAFGLLEIQRAAHPGGALGYSDDHLDPLLVLVTDGSDNASEATLEDVLKKAERFDKSDLGGVRVLWKYIALEGARPPDCADDPRCPYVTTGEPGDLGLYAYHVTSPTVLDFGNLRDSREQGSLVSVQVEAVGAPPSVDVALELEGETTPPLPPGVSLIASLLSARLSQGDDRLTVHLAVSGADELDAHLEARGDLSFRGKLRLASSNRRVEIQPPELPFVLRWKRGPRALITLPVTGGDRWHLGHLDAGSRPIDTAPIDVSFDGGAKSVTLRVVSATDPSLLALRLEGAGPDGGRGEVRVSEAGRRVVLRVTPAEDAQQGQGAALQIVGEPATTELTVRFSDGQELRGLGELSHPVRFQVMPEVDGWGRGDTLAQLGRIGAGTLLALATALIAIVAALWGLREWWRRLLNGELFIDGEAHALAPLRRRLIRVGSAPGADIPADLGGTLVLRTEKVEGRIAVFVSSDDLDIRKDGDRDDEFRLHHQSEFDVGGRSFILVCFRLGHEPHDTSWGSP